MQAADESAEVSGLVFQDMESLNLAVKTMRVGKRIRRLSARIKLKLIHRQWGKKTNKKRRFLISAGTWVSSCSTRVSSLA